MMEMPPLPDAGLIYMGLTGNPEHAYSAAQMLAYGESCARMAREEERERVLEIVRRFHTWRDASGRLSPVGEEISAAIRSRRSPESAPR